MELFEALMETSHDNTGATSLPHGDGVEVLRVLALVGGDDLPAGHHHLVLGGDVVEQPVLVARALDPAPVDEAADGEVVQLRHHPMSSKGSDIQDLRDKQVRSDTEEVQMFKYTRSGVNCKIN